MQNSFFFLSFVRFYFKLGSQAVLLRRIGSLQLDQWVDFSFHYSLLVAEQ
jgi:hypothetical protein